MKTIGLLGGMSWESSAEWYRLANIRVRDRLGGHHSAKIILDSVDFAEVEALQADGSWDAAAALLSQRARSVEAAGADVLVLCTNTMHLVADAIQSAVDIPLVHIADTTASAVVAAHVRTVGLLGTAFTMEQPFYRDRLEQHGIHALVPDAQDRAVVHDVIYSELVHGVVKESSRARYREIIARLVAAGAEGIVLGCTEIELLISAGDVETIVFPTTAIQVAAVVDLALRTGPGAPCTEMP